MRYFILILSIFFSTFNLSMAQTCRTDIASSTPAGTFIDNGDGTVSDSRTGLLWKQCAQGQSGAGCAAGSATASATLAEALLEPDNENVVGFAGRHDWRLPNIEELQTLLHTACIFPAIDRTFFPNIPNPPFDSIFWSASEGMSYGGSWVVYFGSGTVLLSNSSESIYVRLVRGGQSLLLPADVTFTSENLYDYSYQIGDATKSWHFTSSDQPINGLKVVLVSTDTGMEINDTQWQLGDVVANTNVTFELPINPVHSGPAIKTAVFRFEDSAGNQVPISNSPDNTFWVKLRTNIAPQFSNALLTSHSLTPGEVISLSLPVNDPEGDSVSCSVTGGGSVSGSCQYSGSFSTPGVHVVTVTASDGQSSSDLTLHFVVADGVSQPFLFTDIPTTSSSFEALHYLALKGIVIGHPGAVPGEREFLPEDLVNSAEALGMLMQAAAQRGIFTLEPSITEYENLRPLGNSGEIRNFSWAAPYLDMAEELGVIINPRQFDPAARPTREWLAQFLVTLLGLWNPDEVIVNTSLYRYNDQASFTTTDYYNAARITAFYGLLGTLNSNFAPLTEMTREGVALVAAKILQMPLADEVSTSLPAVQIDGRASLGIEQGGSFQLSGLSGLSAPMSSRSGDQVSEVTSGATSRTRAYVVVEGAGRQGDQTVSSLSASPLSLTANWDNEPRTLQKSLLIILENTDADVRSAVHLPFWVTFTDNDGDGVQDIVDSDPTDIHHGSVSDNHPPYVESLSQSVDSSQIFSSSMSATDLEQDPLTFSVVTSPSMGQFEILDSALGIFTYTPNPTANGTDTIVVRATDSHGGTGQGMLTLHVTYVVPVVIDIDGDTIPDSFDNCLSVSNVMQVNTDEDGEGDACDLDDDNDGVNDTNDAFPLDATETVDTDGDGIGNNADPDDDNDGVLDEDDLDPLDPEIGQYPRRVISEFIYILLLGN